MVLVFVFSQNTDFNQYLFKPLAAIMFICCLPERIRLILQIQYLKFTELLADAGLIGQYFANSWYSNYFISSHTCDIMETVLLARSDVFVVYCVMGSLSLCSL